MSWYSRKTDPVTLISQNGYAFIVENKIKNIINSRRLRLGSVDRRKDGNPTRKACTE